MNTRVTSRRMLATLSAAACVLLASSTALAQSGPPNSDVLTEVNLNQHGGTVFPNVSFTIPEDASGGEPQPHLYTIPMLTIDFIHPGFPTGQNISDRLHLQAYQVQVTSDDEIGLAPRTSANVIQIPATANETFLPISILAHSDGDSPTQQTQSDKVHFVAGFFSGGPIISPIPDITLFEPTGGEGPDFGGNDPVIPGKFNFTIPAQSFDLYEPNPTGTAGIVSDYVDVGPINGYFLSSDNPGDYDTTLVPDGTVAEDGLFATDTGGPDPNYGGDLNYSLGFVSDVVPEPGSLVLLSLGGLALVAHGWRRRRAG